MVCSKMYIVRTVLVALLALFGQVGLVFSPPKSSRPPKPGSAAVVTDHAQNACGLALPVDEKLRHEFDRAAAALSADRIGDGVDQAVVRAWSLSDLSRAGTVVAKFVKNIQGSPQMSVSQTSSVTGGSSLVSIPELPERRPSRTSRDFDEEDDSDDSPCEDVGLDLEPLVAVTSDSEDSVKSTRSARLAALSLVVDDGVLLSEDCEVAAPVCLVAPQRNRTGRACVDMPSFSPIAFSLAPPYPVAPAFGRIASVRSRNVSVQADQADMASSEAPLLGSFSLAVSALSKDSSVRLCGGRSPAAGRRMGGAACSSVPLLPSCIFHKLYHGEIKCDELYRDETMFLFVGKGGDALYATLPLSDPGNVRFIEGKNPALLGKSIPELLEAGLVSCEYAVSIATQVVCAVNPERALTSADWDSLDEEDVRHMKTVTKIAEYLGARMCNATLEGQRDWANKGHLQTVPWPHRNYAWSFRLKGTSLNIYRKMLKEFIKDLTENCADTPEHPGRTLGEHFTTPELRSSTEAYYHNLELQLQIFIRNLLKYRASVGLMRMFLGKLYEESAEADSKVGVDAAFAAEAAAKVLKQAAAGFGLEA